MTAVSVVLPTFNRSALLGRAIASVLAQDFTDFELIVVDDGSTDGTGNLVRGVPDPRVRYLRLPRNRGAAAARNAGIAAAAGSWIAFQDSDDEWLPGKLAQQWAVAGSAPAEVGLVLGGYVAETATGQAEIKPHHILAGEQTDADVLAGWPIITPTWLVRRALLETLGGFDAAYPCLEDWDLALRLSACCQVRAVPGPMLVKHRATDSICADDAQLCRALERILETHGARWRAFGRLKARRLAHLACLQFRLGRRAEARASLRAALASAPGAVAPLGLLLASLAGGRAMRLAQRLFPRYATMAP